MTILGVQEKCTSVDEISCCGRSLMSSVEWCELEGCIKKNGSSMKFLLVFPIQDQLDCTEQKICCISNSVFVYFFTVVKYLHRKHIELKNFAHLLVIIHCCICCPSDDKNCSVQFSESANTRVQVWNVKFFENTQRGSVYCSPAEQN